MGADDYVAKPYNPQELAARVKVISAGIQVLGISIKQMMMDVSRMAGWSSIRMSECFMWTKSRSG